MPRKLDPDRSPNEKVLSLFAKLLFSRQPHSLTDLAESLHCSKQTVLRYVDEIDRMPEIRVERESRGNRKYFSIPNRRVPSPSEWVTEEELVLLWMCRSFTRNVLGMTQFESATRALERSALAMKDQDAAPTSRHFSSLRWGGIDYDPHGKVLAKLIEAMDASRVCEVAYLRAGGKRAKTFHVKPLKIFTHRDTLYLHGERAKSPGKPYRVPKFQPILAVHRLQKVTVTETPFVPPKDYDFARALDRHFGLIQEKQFKVVAEFDDWAATYVAERTWSADQKVTWKKGGVVRLAFSTTSEEEVLSWILSFGAHARLLQPKALAGEVEVRAKAICERYG